MATEMGHAKPTITRTRDEEWSGGVLTEIGLVTWRQLKKLTRNPVLLFFSLFMPLIWLVMFSQTFGTVFSGASQASRSRRRRPSSLNCATDVCQVTATVLLYPVTVASNHFRTSSRFSRQFFR